MLKRLKDKILLRLFGIKPKPKRTDLPTRLVNYTPVKCNNTQEFNNWSTQLFLNAHKN
jgi:hypothetical protein